MFQTGNVVTALILPAAAHGIIIAEGDVGARFYIIKEGEAVVTQGGKEVNRLFRADFFGERSLMHDEPRGASVTALTDMQLLVLDRDTFNAILGPMEKAMKHSKSNEVRLRGVQPGVGRAAVSQVAHLSSSDHPIAFLYK